MNYDEVLKRINSRNQFGIRPGLKRIKRLLELLGDPQDRLKFIHVAGTNGKGSVCKMLSLILEKSSYKTGLFISPYVIDFRERFQINNTMISKNDLVEIFETVEPFLNILDKEGEFVTEFELITAMSFLYFLKNNCDVVILEVGLGGKFDATNVIKSSVLSIIMSISFDHTKILGSTIEKIAKEKAGILKKNGKLILYNQEFKSAEYVIKLEAEKKNCKVLEPDLDEFKVIFESVVGTKFIYKNKEYFLKLCGRHQIKNVSVVFKAIENLKDFLITYENIKDALESISFPARFDVISKNPMVIVDGAHNFSSINILKRNLIKFFGGKNIIGIAAMLKDKDVDSCLKDILPLFSKVVVTKINNPRSLCENEIFDISSKYCEKEKIFKENNSLSAFNKALSLFSPGDVIVVFGSLYFSSEIYNLKNKS